MRVQIVEKSKEENGAGGGTRTRDLLITNQLLWPSELRQHARNIGSRGREVSGSLRGRSAGG